MTFGYASGLGHAQVVPLNMLVETIHVLVVYSLFALSWRQLIRLQGRPNGDPGAPTPDDVRSTRGGGCWNNRELEVFRGWQHVGRNLTRPTRFDALLRVDRRRFPCLHRLGTPLLRLLRRIETLERGGPAAAPPAWTRNNAWGRFRFHAHRLDPATGAEPLFGITVRPQQPLPVRLLDHIEHLALPPRQAQVCLGIASGQTSRQIARRLAIAESTVISHTRAVYSRMGARAIGAN
jgi:hypothetical protein